MIDIRHSLIIFLGGTCALCSKQYPDDKSWTIHHRMYRSGEKSSKDFKEKITYIPTKGKNKGHLTKKNHLSQGSILSIHQTINV